MLHATDLHIAASTCSAEEEREKEAFFARTGIIRHASKAVITHGELRQTGHHTGSPVRLGGVMHCTRALTWPGHGAVAEVHPGQGRQILSTPDSL